MPPEVIGVRRVAVTMEAMQQVADIEVEAGGETDGFKDALLVRLTKEVHIDLKKKYGMKV